jgi:hypothetical protein
MTQQDPTPDPALVFSAAFGAAFALELHSRLGLAHGKRSPRLLIDVTHEALTVARSAVQGMHLITGGSSG